MSAKNSRAPVMALVGAMALGLIALAWWLVSGTTAEPAVADLTRSVLSGAQPAAVQLPDVSSRALPSGTLASAIDPAGAPAPVPAGPPESYLRALGGLIGRVVEEDATPVAQFTLELVGGRRSTILRSVQAFSEEGGLDVDPVIGRAVTDAEGRFVFERLPPESLAVLVLDPGGPRGRIHPLEITPVSGAVSDLGDIVLPGGATIAGRAVDQRGDPLPGVRVRALDVPFAELGAGFAEIRAGGGLLVPEADFTMGKHDVVVVPESTLVAQLERRLPLPTAITDADGRFELPGLKVGMTSLFLDEPSHVATVRSGLPTGPAGGRRDHGDFVLGDGEAALGRVLDDKGQPLAEAEVLAGNPLGLAPVTILKGRGARTDAEGRFRVPGLRPGAIWIAARPAGARTWIPQEAYTGRSETVLRVPAPRRMLFSVFTPDGKPVEELEVFGRPSLLDDQLPDLFLPPVPLADRLSRTEDGDWQIQPLEPEPWQFVLRAPGCADERLMVDLRASDEQRSVTLRTSGHVLVTVTDAVSGEPIEHALVEVVEDPAEFAPPLASRRSDARGEARLERLPPMQERVAAVVSHPGYATAVASFALPASEPVAVSLGRGARILGLVLDRNGPPTERLLVVLVTRDVAGEMVPFRSTLTDAEGRFSFERVPAGEASVQVRTRRQIELGTSFFETFFESPLAEESDVAIPPSGDVELLLALNAAFDDVETGELSGQLLVNGLPAPDWKLYTWGRIRRVATTDEGGHFDLGQVASGTVTLVASPAGTGFMAGSVERFEIELAPNERRHELLRLQVGAIEGRVTDSVNGRPVEGVVVRPTPEGSQRSVWGRGLSAVSDASGRFRIEPVAAGAYLVRAEVEGYATGVSAAVEVREYGTATGADIALQRPLRVSGRVQLAGVEGSPRWMWLTARTENGRRATSRVDTETMSFEMDDLSTGEWTFHLGTDKGPMEPVTLGFSADRSDVALVFRPQLEEDEDG